MDNHDKITVAVTMITYNHEKYIARAIEGVVTQQTNFKFTLFISDDKSPDNTAKICQQYQEKYHEIIDLNVFSENRGASANGIFNLKRCNQSGAKYIAVCEGDDYWIDPLKLQKQVDFLEANPDYGMVHSNLHEYNVTKKIWYRNIWSDKKFFQEGNLFNSFLVGRTSMIYLCTTTYRKYLVMDYLDDLLNLNLAMGDSFIFLMITAQSKVGYFPESTAVRQILPVSATQGLDYKKQKRFSDSGIKLIEYISQKFQIDPEILRLIKKSYILRRLELFRRNGRKKEFKEVYSAFREEYFEIEAELSRIALLGKYPHYFSKIMSKMLVKLNLDFKSKVYRKFKKQGLLPS